MAQYNRLMRCRVGLDPKAPFEHVRSGAFQLLKIGVALQLCILMTGQLTFRGSDDHPKLTKALLR